MVRVALAAQDALVVLVEPVALGNPAVPAVLAALVVSESPVVPESPEVPAVLESRAVRVVLESPAVAEQAHVLEAERAPSRAGVAAPTK